MGRHASVSGYLVERKYLAFDLVIAKAVPDGERLSAHRPLGICCAAMLAGDTGRLVVWHGRTTEGEASGRMNPEETKAMVQTLIGLTDSGYTLVTWNGLSFDFSVMAEESGLGSQCLELLDKHVDMMFHVYCVKGQYLELEAAAIGMGLASRVSMAGKDAPRIWARGEHQQALDNLSEGLRTTLDVALACEQRKVLLWTNKRGSTNGMDLPGGWLTVPEAAQLKGIDPTQWQWDR